LGDEVNEKQAQVTGAALAKQLNDWWKDVIDSEYRLRSYLEIEFESLFVHFLMPTVRGAATGSKKRYAGCVRDNNGELEMIFKGLETVRTDWTPLARSFQRELYRRIFLNEPYQDYISDIVTRLHQGEFDHELVYRKRLRRPLDAYQRNVPPHVRAARKSNKHRKWVSYVITLDGPEPVDNHSARLDYDHYREKQLKPVADGVLHFLDTSFDEITTNQMTIF
jgi:DNA polymerase-2